MSSKRFWYWSAGVVLALILVGVALEMSVMAPIMKSIDDYYFPAEIVMRAPSPDGKVDAVLLKKPRGARRPNLYWVELIPKDISKPDSSAKVFLADDVGGGIRVLWLDNQSVHIEFEFGDVQDFSNVWHKPPVDDSSPPYVVRLSYSAIGPRDPGYRATPPIP